MSTKSKTTIKELNLLEVDTELVDKLLETYKKEELLTTSYGEYSSVFILLQRDNGEVVHIAGWNNYEPYEREILKKESEWYIHPEEEQWTYKSRLAASQDIGSYVRPLFREVGEE